MKATSMDKRLLSLILILSFIIWGSIFGVAKIFYILIGSLLALINFLLTDYLTKKDMKYSKLMIPFRQIYTILVFIGVALLNWKTKNMITSLIACLIGYTIVEVYYLVMKYRGKDLC